MPSPLWGVDSGLPADEKLLACVETHYGKPQVWRRYLQTVPGAAEGLTRAEVMFLHRHGIKILLVYSAFRQPVGYRRGTVDAHNAIYRAKLLGVPHGVALFANVERFFPVDEAWIRGFADTFGPSNYKAGFYHDPTEGGFSRAFCEAAAKEPRLRTQTVLWSAQPEVGVSKRKDAPPFKPAGPNCPANVWAWQYGRNSAACPVDTDLISPLLVPLLW